MFNIFALTTHLSFILVIFFSGCTAPKKIIQNPAVVVQLEKTGCLGTCPVFTLSVYSDRSVIFIPRAYTLTDSVQKTEISEKIYSDLLNSFRVNQFEKMDNEYMAPVIDAPVTYLSFSENDLTKKVQSRGDEPPVFRSLVRQVEMIAENAGWLPVNDMTKKDKKEIILHLKEDADLKSITAVVAEYGLVFIKKIAPNQAYYLFSLEKDTSVNILSELRKNPAILAAQWNHQLNKREK